MRRQGVGLVEFKAIIADPKSGTSYSTMIGGHQANSLVGKRIGDEIDGIFVDLPGYKLKITGGSDKTGTPMRRDIPGGRKKRVLVTKGVGFRPKDKGVRKRKTFRGNAISQEISQLNLRVTQRGPRSIEDS
ncbi:MAG: 30S ribosomal protein S6e, partial [Thermoplasmata archaeon]